MNKFNPNATCVKCGSNETSTEYKREWQEGGTSWMKAPETRHRIPEHMLRTCNHCGYSWDELPLDAE